MMQNARQQQYLKVQVETASPGELTLLLYQEMVKSLLRAKQLYSQHQYAEMNDSLHKVRSILNELIVTLNTDYDIAKDLANLYMFYNQHIAQFIISRDVKMLDDVLEFAKGMVETWKQALLQLKTGGK
ncbi:flagellar export chaperone FliS [Paenibacillus alvei]|nr:MULTISPECIES: flagellar export chaperone FliS [Paenibacillus]MCY7485253.1 flagellar export chaperone FliS [Paenibacillus alvei]MCY9579908.1 flagellar export chaperone FliS [Paenibacillus alvei]MCY9584085.1 flagellar export chaperone FliS [Paenibacillus alvei]MCY9759571.1 flagellar export chaperone FliS [Paenibacillus alvei]MCY9766367.1 flagellar export chaperone FliS [Paenibacillus alvei]